MLRQRGQSEGPIGGEGLAAPAGTCNFRYPVTFVAISHSSCCFRTSPETSQDGGAVQRMIGDHPSPPTALLPSPSPRSSRGEGWGEGPLRRFRLAESPPHPDRKNDPTSPRKRGE